MYDARANCDSNRNQYCLLQLCKRKLMRIIGRRLLVSTSNFPTLHVYWLFPLQKSVDQGTSRQLDSPSVLLAQAEHTLPVSWTQTVLLAQRVQPLYSRRLKDERIVEVRWPSDFHCCLCLESSFAPLNSMFCYCCLILQQLNNEPKYVGLFGF